MGPRGFDEGGGRSVPRRHVIRMRLSPSGRVLLDPTPAGANQMPKGFFWRNPLITFDGICTV